MQISTEMPQLRTTGIVLLSSSFYGGAERRFINLFCHLTSKYPEKFFLFVSKTFFNEVCRSIPDFPIDKCIVITSGKSTGTMENTSSIDKNSYSTDLVVPGFIKQVKRFVVTAWNNYLLYRKIKKHQQKLNIQVILAVFSAVYPLYYFLCRKHRNVKIIFNDMDSAFVDIYPNSKKYWYRFFASFNFALEKADVIDCLSPSIYEGLLQKGFNLEFPRGQIAPCSFTDYKKCKIGNKSKFEVTFLGRLEQSKNPLIFLDAAKEMVNHYDITFNIIGSGRLEKVVVETINDVQSDKIRYHGHQVNPIPILAESSVFVSLQQYENYPSQSLLEAMGCQNAIIATDVGDTRLLINERNGILIPVDTEALHAAIKKLYFDRELCLKLGVEARNEVINNQTIDRMGKYYETLFC